MKTIICFGTFDVLHLGHLNYFQQAKKIADKLIVVIARDKNTKKKKLLFTEKERLKLVQSLQIVDYAVLGSLTDQYKVIEKIKPEFILLGYDHQITEKSLTAVLKEKNLPVKVKRAKAYYPSRYKSSKIKSTVR